MESTPKKLKTRVSMDHPGHAHALTFSTFQRKPLLHLPGIPEIVLGEIDQTCTQLALDLFAYVIMPEHVHLFIHPKNPEYKIAEVLKAIKSRSAKRIFQIHPQLRAECTKSKEKPAQFWLAGGGFDRNVYDAEQAWNVITYIHRNPVKRGLCTEESEFLWSSASAYRKGTSLRSVKICDWQVNNS